MVLNHNIYIGNALECAHFLKNESIDCLVTSPPYWGPRDYNTPPQEWGGDPTCNHEFEPDTSGERCKICGCWKGELGREPTPNEYISHLCWIFEALTPKLKKTATMWINIGDMYSGGVNNNDSIKEKRGSVEGVERIKGDAPPKSLLLIPTRFAWRMVEKGWILRNVIPWVKPSCIPSSVDDRYTVNWEYIFFFVRNDVTTFWEHTKTKEMIYEKPPKIDEDPEGEGTNWEEVEKIVMDETGEMISIKRKVSLWKGRDYYFNMPYEPIAENTKKRYLSVGNLDKRKDGISTDNGLGMSSKNNIECVANMKKRIESGEQLMRHARAVWEFSPVTEGAGSHFAAFPPELPKRAITAGCPLDGTVLDPFGGTGTTMKEARNQERNCVIFELNEESVKKELVDKLRLKEQLPTGLINYKITNTLSHTVTEIQG